MADLMRPIVNLNGTSRSALIDQRVDARNALVLAMEALGETRPNGRDYIGKREAYKRDLAIFQRRFSALDQIYNELMDEALAIQEGEP
jgi:hypothetical protein